MRWSLLMAAIAVTLITPAAARAADAALDRAKLELVVDEAKELMSEAERPGSATHAAAYRYYFGLVYGSGTNLLARTSSSRRATRISVRP